MRLALTVYDDNGALEITSVDCNSFVGGCNSMADAINTVMWRVRGLESLGWSSTATLEGPAADIMFAVGRMGDLEDLPTVISC